jgi:peptidoglycan-associated lipoprotein
MKRSSNAPLRLIALAGLMIWVLFGCSRCGRGDEALTGMDTAPRPGVDDPSTTDGTPLGQRPPAGPATLIEEMEVIHFDYDSDALKPQAIEALERNARWLRENPTVQVLIEGHCDERGTDEYNYALGERRANTVYGYLLRLDVPNSLYTRSYGETRPTVEGHDESAWQYNRRVQFSRYAD